MLTTENIQLVKEYVDSAQTILVIFPSNPKVDVLASATALYLGLLELKKDVTVLSPETVKQPVDFLSGLEKVSTQLGNHNLQVSFEYEEDMVDKVSYHIDEEEHKFHLVIQPKKNAQPLKSDTVTFSYTGAAADLILFVGVKNYDELADLSLGYETFLQETQSVSIHWTETEVGTVKLNTSGSASVSESMAFLLQELAVPMTSDVATNLLAGIEDATESFRSLSSTANTFEIVAQLLRLGARRVRRKVTELVPPPAPSPEVHVLSKTKTSSINSTNSTNGFAAALKPKKKIVQPGPSEMRLA